MNSLGKSWDSGSADHDLLQTHIDYQGTFWLYLTQMLVF
jgi:hypothetical protein